MRFERNPRETLQGHQPESAPAANNSEFQPISVFNVTQTDIHENDDDPDVPKTARQAIESPHRTRWTEFMHEEYLQTQNISNLRQTCRWEDSANKMGF